MAMSAPLVGHLDPYFQGLMDETVSLLRYVFRTKNKLTFPISGTGSAGMEAAFENFLEPGDVAVIAVNGVFGERMVDNAQRTELP
jgi:alanine-glyoxylate transaminase/serine-glyoxylate transaminase/serine-pyruvate transaminase